MNESTNHKDNIYTGNVSLGDILEVLPYRSTIERVEVMGNTLRKVLEHSVSNLNPDDPPGIFLQYSGKQWSYSLFSKPHFSYITFTERSMDRI